MRLQRYGQAAEQMASTGLLPFQPEQIGEFMHTMEQEGFPAALKAARSFRPDLVVLDLMPPGLDGIQVLRRLRQGSDIHVRRALLFRLHRRWRPS